MEKIEHILVIAGEASGDLNAARLIEQIKKIRPEIEFCGVGGSFMRQAGVDLCADIKDLSVIGVFDVLKKIPQFLKLRDLILKQIEEKKPCAIILVDFSGFNLRLAKKINKRIPVIYYTSPQVWASRPGRVETIKKYVSKMIVFFEFEKQFYDRHGLTADFVGHPLLETVKPSLKKDEFLKKFGLSDSKQIIALLPGSRRSEIKYILPVMLAASKILAEKISQCQFIIAKSANVSLEHYQAQIKSFPQLKPRIIEGMTYDCVNAASFCMVASGTATLETAIIQTPFVIIYKTGLLNYFFYRPQIKTAYIGMPNILAQSEIIPEFIQFKGIPQKIAQRVLTILKAPSETAAMKSRLNGLITRLGQPGAVERAARLIVNYLVGEV